MDHIENGMFETKGSSTDTREIFFGTLHLTVRNFYEYFNLLTNVLNTMKIKYVIQIYKRMLPRKKKHKHFKYFLCRLTQKFSDLFQNIGGFLKPI